MIGISLAARRNQRPLSQEPTGAPCAGCRHHLRKAGSYSPRRLMFHPRVTHWPSLADLTKAWMTFSMVNPRWKSTEAEGRPVAA